MSHTILVPKDTRRRASEYLTSLRNEKGKAGCLLRECLRGVDLASLTVSSFLDLLINTKVPQIFAESAILGDGSDWNLTELSLLGDISIAVPVTIFDNGNHHAPAVHEKPFGGMLVFTPGALLRNDRGFPPADWAEVVGPDRSIRTEGFYRLYERRLLPVFQHVNTCAAGMAKSALITIPGLGCGQFAGSFRGRLGRVLQDVLEQFLAIHGKAFPNVKAVYYDPYSECSNQRFAINGISLMVRPLLRGNEAKSQLCLPPAYAEEGDDFSDCTLTSIVAWDHVSWPGNDFYSGSRSTDDGVKAAATDSMAVLTGVQGHYDATIGAYLPPPPFRTWEEVVHENKPRL